MTEKYAGVVERRFWSADSDINVCRAKMTAIQPMNLVGEKNEVSFDPRCFDQDRVAVTCCG